jgi:Sigma-70 region 2
MITRTIGLQLCSSRRWSSWLLDSLRWAGSNPFDHPIPMSLNSTISAGSASVVRKAQEASVALRSFLPSLDARWNNIGRERVEEADDRERQASTKSETLRARFESQMLPLMDEAYNLALWLMKNHQDAQDVVQEAYLRAFRYFEGYSGESGKAWLLKIVRNVCLNCFSHRKAEGNVALLDDTCLEVEDLAPLPSLVLEKKARSSSCAQLSKLCRPTFVP